MSLKRVAVRYAEALIELAREQRKLEQIKQDMDLFRSLTRNEEFFHMLKSPVITNAKKETIVRQLLSDKVDELSLRFLNLLIQKERSDILPDIAQDFQGSYMEIMGISKVRVIAREKISQGSIDKLVGKLKEVGLVKDKVEIEQEQNEEVIGGFTVVVDDYIYNASVNKQLLDLKRDFSENLYKSKIIKR